MQRTLVSVPLTSASFFADYRFSILPNGTKLLSTIHVPFLLMSTAFSEVQSRLPQVVLTFSMLPLSQSFFLRFRSFVMQIPFCPPALKLHPLIAFRFPSCETCACPHTLPYGRFRPSWTCHA